MKYSKCAMGGIGSSKGEINPRAYMAATKVVNYLIDKNYLKTGGDVKNRRTKNEYIDEIERIISKVI